MSIFLHYRRWVDYHNYFMVVFLLKEFNALSLFASGFSTYLFPPNGWQKPFSYSNQQRFPLKIMRANKINNKKL